MPQLRAGVRYCKREPNFFVITEVLYWLYIQFMTQIKPPQCQMYGSSSTDLDSFFIYLYGGGVAWHHSELSWQELLEASILLEIEIADPSSMTGLAPVICNCVLVDGWCFIYNAGIIIIYTLVLTDDGGKKWTVIINTTQLIIITRRVVHHENQSIMAYIICLHQKIRQLTWSHFKMYLSYYILPVKLIVSYDFFSSIYATF